MPELAYDRIKYIVKAPLMMDKAIMAARFGQPLERDDLSQAFQRRCEDLTSFIGQFQGCGLPNRDLLIQQLELLPLEGSDDGIVERTVSSTIPSRYTEEATFADFVVRNTLDNLISDLENQLVNGEEGNGSIQGFLSYSHTTALQRNGEGVLRFWKSAINEYLSQSNGQGSNESSSHDHVIMLPREEKLRIAGDQQELGGLRILSSDFLPKGHGLIFDASDFRLLVDPSLEWEIDKERAGHPIRARYHAGTNTRQAKALVLQVNY